MKCTYKSCEKQKKKEKYVQKQKRTVCYNALGNKSLDSCCEEGQNSSDKDGDKGVSNGHYVNQSKIEKSDDESTSNMYSLAS